MKSIARSSLIMDWQCAPGKTATPPTLRWESGLKKCGDLSEIYGIMYCILYIKQYRVLYDVLYIICILYYIILCTCVCYLSNLEYLF